jgi:hypothetical protein
MARGPCSAKTRFSSGKRTNGRETNPSSCMVETAPPRPSRPSSTLRSRIHHHHPIPPPSTRLPLLQPWSPTQSSRYMSHRLPLGQFFSPVLRRDLFPEYKRINHKMKFWEEPSIFLVLFKGSFKDPRYCSLFLRILDIVP